MKRLLVIIVLFSLAVTIWLFFRVEPQSVLPTPSSSPSPQSISFNNQTYHYAWVKIDSLDRLQLLPNYEAKLDSQQLIQNHSCRVLVNAGFYDQNHQPLGWFVSHSQQLSAPIKSDFLNGFFSLTDGQAMISASLTPQAQFGLQSGPLLILNHQTLPLKIKNDQPNRRLAAALTDSNQLIFLVLTGSDSTYSGPMLADTPALVAKLGKTINQSFVSALNLDGGSASAFYTPEIYLKEFSSIGSFFCYN